MPRDESPEQPQTAPDRAQRSLPDAASTSHEPRGAGQGQAGVDSEPVPLLTRNLFRSSGEGDYQLRVLSGAWPRDMDGAMYVVGPDKREPGGHWFGGPGIVLKLNCQADSHGLVHAQMRRVRTPMHRLRERHPNRFAVRGGGMLEVSPYGLTNLANTNLQAMNGRLFVGYDVGRPVEIDPQTLDYITAVGSADEWAIAIPGAVDPLVMITAHPAPDWDADKLYFVNYRKSHPRATAQTFIAEWDMEGKIHRWELTGLSNYDSLHDVKATENYIVFTDLPFITEPDKPGRPRRKCQEFTQLWIVRKADLRATQPGGQVPVRELRLPMPTGHLTVDYTNDPNHELVVYLQHVPATDLASALGPESRRHRSGDTRNGDARFDPEYFGLPTVGPQPATVGRYRIDAETGEVLESKVAWDSDGVWAPLLASQNVYAEASKRRPENLFYAGMGVDLAMLPQDYYERYRDAQDLVVPLDQLPNEGTAAAVARFDLLQMQVADVFHYAEPGVFPHPPTFVPRRGASHDLDGYVLVVVHRDEAKQIHVFDAADLRGGPIATAGADGFNPPLMLHSTWMETPKGPRRSRYRISEARNLWGALKSAPEALAHTLRENAAFYRGRRGPGSGTK